MKKKIAIIGAGFSGLSAASYLAKAGHDVHVFERHAQAGGRARQFSTEDGFVFDMGPSWYWMPDMIEDFFADFGEQTADYMKLVSLDPQFDMVFSQQKMSLPSSFEAMQKLFEETEPGAGRKLAKFMKAARFKYEIGMRDFVQKPCHSWLEFISPKIAQSAIKLDLLTNFRKYIAKYFISKELRTIMEFPVIFLGASPKNIPALYSLMNYGGYVLGTHYPMGGFYQLVLAMQQIAEKQGVNFHFNSQVQRIQAPAGRVTSLLVNDVEIKVDALVGSSDYQHTESLLDEHLRNYTDAYWESRTFAPSCLIYYLGFDEKLPQLTHHTLFFEHELDDHIDCIYSEKKWPENPLFYVCCPSKTDPSVAPAGKENIFLLMPVAIGIEDDESIREKYLAHMLKRLETHTGASDLSSKIIYQRSYGIRDFKADYGAFGGNAYGLANTLSQTAVLKPKIVNKRVKNLYYTGQLTVPGPGVPPSIISGKIVAEALQKTIKRYETAI